jgi:hypothetical protein
MPIVTVSYTEQEVFDLTVTAARALSDRVLKLSDLNASPLVPGETPDMRRHQIAKLGKQLAEAFVTLDNLFKVAAEERAKAQAEDVTATAPGPNDPNAN